MPLFPSSPCKAAIGENFLIINVAFSIRGKTAKPQTDYLTYQGITFDEIPKTDKKSSCCKNSHTSVSDSLSSALGLGLRAEGDALLADPGLVICSSRSRRDLAAVADGIPTWEGPLKGLLVGLLPSACL